MKEVQPAVMETMPVGAISIKHDGVEIDTGNSYLDFAVLVVVLFAAYKIVRIWRKK